jgi:hypothetical protein
MSMGFHNPYNLEEISLGIHKLSINNKLCQKVRQKGITSTQIFNTSLYQAKMIDFYKSVLKI